MTVPDMTCKSCRHRKHTVFQTLPSEFLAKIDSGKTVHRFERGQVLFYAGTPVLAVYCIVSGTVKLTRSTGNGHQIVLRLLTHGRLAGLRSVLSDRPSAVTAEVVEPALICIIPRPIIEDLLTRSPSLCRALLRETARELTISEEMLLDVTYLPAETRVARLLLGIADGNHGTGAISTALSRQDMAAAVRLTPQTLSRVLRDMTALGILDSNRQRIIVRDPDRLRKAAQQMR